MLDVDSTDREVVLLVAKQIGLPPHPVPNREEMLATGKDLEKKLGVVVRPLLESGPWLEVNARLLAKNFGDEQLAQLAPIAADVHRFDIGGTAVTDAGLNRIRRRDHRTTVLGACSSGVRLSASRHPNSQGWTRWQA